MIAQPHDHYVKRDASSHSGSRARLAGAATCERRREQNPTCLPGGEDGPIDAHQMLRHLDRMSAIDVRLAVAQDLPALRRIFRRASLSNDGDRDVLSAHPEALELRDDGMTAGRTRVAVASDGTIVGFITVLPGDGSALEREDLFVDPNWMRQGVARSLMADVIATARRDGSARIEVTANPHADGFYRSVGFRANARMRDVVRACAAHATRDPQPRRSQVVLGASVRKPQTRLPWKRPPSTCRSRPIRCLNSER